MNRYEEYEIGRFVFVPGRDIYPIYIRLKPETLDRPGILAKILEVLTSRGIPVMHAKISRPSLGKPIKFLVFIDLTRKIDQLDKIINEIKQLVFVEHVAYEEPVFKGFAAFGRLFPLTMFGERAIVLRRVFYEAMIKHLRRRLGTGLEAILYHIGFEAGKRVYDAHVQMVGKNTFRLIKSGEVLFTQMGFGRIKVTDMYLEEARMRIIVYDSFECELFRGEGRPMSNLIRGMMAGWVSRLLKRDISVKEVRCVAKGDPYCEFVVEAVS